MTLVGFAVVLDLQISEIDIEQIMGTMEDSVLQYGAELQDIHVHGILDSSGLQVSGTSEAATAPVFESVNVTVCFVAPSAARRARDAAVGAPRDAATDAAAAAAVAAASVTASASGP